MAIEVRYEDLANADLVVECVYKSGPSGNWSDDVLPKLIPRCESSGGFRKKKREDGSGKYAYVVLYTTMQELEWPDYLDEETGIFRYYGDNREPGKALLDTWKKGNKVLEEVFSLLNSGESLCDMPPFFVFKRASNQGRDVQFLGLAAPGNPKLSQDKDLVAFWRTIDGQRFQNYEAYFTILDTGAEPISRKWLESLIYDHDNSYQYAPDAWLRFINEGRNGIEPLKAPKVKKPPSKYRQLQCDDEGEKCLEIIRNYYKDNPYEFEVCAMNLLYRMDDHFVDFDLTRPWRDGGRDAVGKYAISTGGKAHDSLIIDCAMEAKCYSASNGVGVKNMSRLISRIRYRQFGIMITTSYVSDQAYREVVEDGHPILIVTASDIAAILRQNGIDTSNIKPWLASFKDTRAV